MTGTSVDHGYAWVVLLACFLIRLIVDGFWSSLGVLLVNWEIYFNASASETSWIGSSFMLILLSSAPFSSALAHRYTYKVVVMCAGILSCISLFAMTFVTQLWQIYICMSLLGIGLGLSYQPALIFYVYYFDKHFALANGLNAIATGLGIIASSPCMEVLIRSYGWRGALQIASAALGNICVCGLLLRPPSSKRLRNQKRTTDSNSNGDENVDVKDYGQTQTRGGLLHEIANGFDLSLFRNVVFIFQCIISGLLFGLGIFTSVIYLVPHAVDANVSVLRSTFLMSGYGISMTVLRMSPIGVIVDRKIITASTFGGIGILIAGLSILVISFAVHYSYMVLMGACIVLGGMVGLGGFLIMIVIAYSGGSKAKAPGATAWFLLLCGVGSLFGIIITGYLYDSSGSYRSSMILSGICTMLLGFNVLADPLFKRWQTHLDRKTVMQSLPSTQYYDTLSDIAKPTPV